jgi:dTDP-4-amino-4,6-dideoxygalactose transaminase
MRDIAVPFLDVGATYRELKGDIDAAYQRVMDSGWYLLGGELEAFEVEFATFAGAGACAGVGSGLDALILGLRALDVGPGDEVIVPSNTYIATWLAVTAVGATIVPVEPDTATYNLTGEGVASAITPRTAAILPVHLYGLPADVTGIAAVAQQHAVPVIYDAAQAHGARHDDRPIGSFGDLSAWSFYPGKNLGAFADAGAVTSNDPSLIERVRRLRNYGSEVKYLNLERGVNSRLDELQAAVLRAKLRHLNSWNARRHAVAERYCQSLAGLSVDLPTVPELSVPAWHLFVVQSANRDALQQQLTLNGVQTLIHYPVPPHRQAAYADLRIDGLSIASGMADKVLSLPIGPHLDDQQVDHVVATMKQCAI